MVNIQQLPSTIALKSKTIFKRKNNQIRFRQCRVVLRDIFQCHVRVERLTPVQIDRALSGQPISTQNLEMTRQQRLVYELQDHCYSKAPITPPKSHIDDVVHYITAQRTAIPKVSTPEYSSLESSSGSESNFTSDENNDDDDDEDDVLIGGHCIVKGKKMAYPIDLDTDDVEQTHNSVVSNGEDAQTHRNSGFNNDEYTNGEEFEHTNGMDLEHSPDLSLNGDDSDDDILFLNRIAEQLEEPADAEVANCDENGQLWPSNRIFGDICLKYLHGSCYGTYCDFPHELPETQTVETRLRSASRREIEKVQNEILLQHDMLMNAFFALFCKFYGREWQTHRESLRRLISVLSIRPAAPSYMKEILGGFLISGMDYSTCIDQLILELDDSLDTQERFEIVWELMIDPRNDRLDEQLKEFKHLLLSDAMVASSAINRILEHQINGELESLRDLTANIVQGTSSITFRKLDPTLLKQYIQLLRSLKLNAGQTIQNKAKQFKVILDC